MNKIGALVVASALLACAISASAEYVVVGKRTYMHSFPFFGC
ncbi:MAG: hypothetical protein PVH29_04995 [Candidatus Zixiibacteriota bacterium]|jgi:hypothetical protein